MLRSLDELEEGFEGISKKSKEDCGDKLEEIRQLTYVSRHIEKTIRGLVESDSSKYRNSLVFGCFLRLVRISGHILFLSCNALYRNAFDDIRHALESVVQALYIDLRHPKTDINTRIEILKEVEGKREYRVMRLIEELKIEHKEKLKEEYKRLSRIVHPSHKQIEAVWRDILEGKGIPATIDCEEISKIYDSMKKMYDIFFFLFILRFPEFKKSLEKNLDFIKIIKVYNLTLLSTVFEVRL